MACRACEAPEASCIESEVADFCNRHASQWRQMLRETQPPVRRPWAPRCLVCHHRPRLLRRSPIRDAWECRWGHEVPGYDLWRANEGAIR